jgi:hypothetical protein
LDAVDEENARTQVCNSLDLYFIACEFFLNSHDSSVCRKPLATDSSKKLAQCTSSSHATPVAAPVGVTGSTTLSAAEACDYCRRAAEILEGLKNREADCDILSQGLIGLTEYSYHYGIPSFSEAHLQRTLGLSVLGPEQFQDG